MPDPSQPDDPKAIGDPASLFDTDEVRPIRVPPKPALADPHRLPASASASEGYEVEGGSIPEDDLPEPAPIPIPTPPVQRPNTRSRPKPDAVTLGPEESGSTEFVTEVSEVDPVWTRSAEWGSDLVRVGAVGLGTLILAWLVGIFSGMGMLVLLLGGAATVLLSYPLLITLERPVRITPEQAVDDFFAAASHHFPHYRRMWLLLSEAGRRSGKFASYEDFRDHWKSRIGRWRREAGVGQYTPLKFEVDAFRADKSTGKETSRADYTVVVSIRDREDVGPIESIRMVHGLVRGPDRMWYLNRGVLEPSSK
jgi:hypothetical protein